MANVFMTHIEQKMEEYHQSDQIRMRLRCIDNIFIIINGKQSDVNQLIEFVDTLHQKLKFTYDSEKDYELPFLDRKVIKTKDQI